MNNQDIRFKSLRTYVSSHIFLVSIASLISLVVVYYMIELLFDFNHIVSLIPAVVIAMAVALIASMRLQNDILKPLVMIKQAIDHVEADKSVMPAPDLEETHYAQDLVKGAATQIYNLATMAQGLTADIQAKKAFFRRTINSVPLGIFILDDKDHLSYANEVGRKYLDQEYKDAIGQNIFNLVKQRYDGNNNLRDWLRDCKANKIQGEQVWERVTIFRTDHSSQKVDMAAHYSKGSSEGVETIVVLFDKTELYSYDETELDYMALAAHEIRGPVTVIRGYIDVLRQELSDGGDVETIELVEKVGASADRLAGYVNNIMKIARVDQGTMRVHIQETDWPATVKTIAGELAARASGTGKTISLSIAENIPTVGVDGVAMTEVLTNIVDNAIKYGSDTDNIIIGITSEGDEVQTTIEDHGDGIPAVVVDKLFSKFYRSHRSRHEISGTGIGLYVCKAIVEAHNGSIWVRSKEGKGTTFGFNIPSHKAAVASSLETESSHPEITRSKSGWIKNHSMTRR